METTHVPSEPSDSAALVDRTASQLEPISSQSAALVHPIPASARLSRHSPSTITPLSPPLERESIERVCGCCGESFDQGDEPLYCKNTCGMPFHKKCVLDCFIEQMSDPAPLSCPYCQDTWDVTELRNLLEDLVPLRPSRRARRGHSPLDSVHDISPQIQRRRGDRQHRPIRPPAATRRLRLAMPAAARVPPRALPANLGSAPAITSRFQMYQAYTVPPWGPCMVVQQFQLGGYHAFSQSYGSFGGFAAYASRSFVVTNMAQRGQVYARSHAVPAVAYMSHRPFNALETRQHPLRRRANPPTDSARSQY